MRHYWALFGVAALALVLWNLYLWFLICLAR
jgi:hypothetical protein